MLRRCVRSPSKGYALCTSASCQILKTEVQYSLALLVISVNEQCGCLDNLSAKEIYRSLFLYSVKRRNEALRSESSIEDLTAEKDAVAYCLSF